MNDIVEGGDKVIDFTTAKKAKQIKITSAEQETTEEYTTADMIHEGVLSFNEQLKLGAKGFIAVIFDNIDQPTFIRAGELDPFLTLGALDFYKADIVNTMIYGHLQFIDEEGELVD